MRTGDSCVGKSTVVQCFHSDGTHYPKHYTMVIVRYGHIFARERVGFVTDNRSGGVCEDHQFASV